MNKKTFKWFVVGFGLTLALVLSIVTAWSLPARHRRVRTPTAPPAYTVRHPIARGPTIRSAGLPSPLPKMFLPAPTIAIRVATLLRRPSRLTTCLARWASAGSEPGASNRLPTAEPAGPGHIVPPETEGQRHVDTVPGSPLIIPGADFRSDGFDPPSMWFSFWGGYLQGGNINTCMMAPAYLPNGATVYDIYASVVDNDASANVWINLYRVDNYDGSVDVMAQMATTDAYAAPDIISLEDYPIDYPLVEYPTYSYYVGTCMSSSSIRSYSVRLWYY